MKIQSLAVIFIIIILPISIVLSSYTKNQIKTLNLQSDYDSKLMSSTYDAVKAFKLNAKNSETSDIASIKMNNIEASINTFFNSVSANWGLSGYKKEELQSYVPALVYTLYDGYYIYSPYTNVTHIDTIENEGKTIYGLKPYIYYSCRYKKGNIDVVITYSLDNYITVQGTVMYNGNLISINESGYLIDTTKVSINGDNVTYRGITIPNEGTLREYVGDTSYPYIKVNGTKYYKDEANNKFFNLNVNEKVYVTESFSVENNDSAIKYYKEAYDFTNRILKQSGGYGLEILTASDAVDIDEDSKRNFGTSKIFELSGIEEPYSSFNQHRLSVIRYSIESNLATAIANYNKYSGSTTSFQMPKLKEDEWDKILNNTCMLSFMQGLPIGGRLYNGYSIVPNTGNKEVVTEDSIYITTSDGQYHKVTDNDLIVLPTGVNIENGYLDIDFEIKYILDEATGIKQYYIPKSQSGKLPYTGCYTSIINHTTVNTLPNDNIYKYLEDKPLLAKVYYTALARERCCAYKVNR